MQCTSFAKHCLVKIWKISKLRTYLGKIFHELAQQRECEIIEGHLCIDHVHMCIGIPPKHAVSEVVGYIKGKSAIAIARDVQGRAKNLRVLTK